MFKITITETRDVRQTVPKKWVKIGQEQKSGAFDDKPYLSDIMGYAPEVETIVKETRDVLIQETDSMDITAVIKAINGIQ